VNVRGLSIWSAGEHGHPRLATASMARFCQFYGQRLNGRREGKFSDGEEFIHFPEIGTIAVLLILLLQSIH
jgi:hypothetical protein